MRIPNYTDRKARNERVAAGLVPDIRARAVAITRRELAGQDVGRVEAHPVADDVYVEVWDRAGKHARLFRVRGMVDA